MVGHDLEGDVALQFRVVRAIDLAHPALAELPLDTLQQFHASIDQDVYAVREAYTWTPRNASFGVTAPLPFFRSLMRTDRQSGQTLPVS